MLYCSEVAGLPGDFLIKRCKNQDSHWRKEQYSLLIVMREYMIGRAKHVQWERIP